MNALPRVITTAIVEDDRLAREALAATFAAEPGFACTGAFATGEEAIAELPKLLPDVVLMDIQLHATRAHALNGIECVRRLKERMPGTDFIMLTVMDDEESVFRSLCAGATGYLLKHASTDELLGAVREVHAGGSAISPGIARLVVRSFQPKSDPGLTDRESEVLTRLCDGENYRSIADTLFISSNTVKAHIKNIYGKLHVNTRAAAVRTALRDRLV